MVEDKFTKYGLYEKWKISLGEKDDKSNFSILH